MNDQRVLLSSSEFQPKNDYILVKPQALPTEIQTPSGIYLDVSPTRVTQRPTGGIVICSGSDKDIKEDMYVLWPETDGIDIEFNDGNFVLLRYTSIIGSKK